MAKRRKHKRIAPVQANLTEAEKRACEVAADREGVSLSTWLRQAAREKLGLGS